MESVLASRPPPKSGSDWDYKDLRAYNIKIVYQNTLDFFGVSDSELPLPRVHDEVLTVEYPEAAQHDDAYLLLSTMNHVVNNNQGKDSSVVDFTAHLFRVLGYVGRAECRSTRNRIQVPISEYYLEILAKPDIGITDDRDENYQIVLLVQEDKANLDSSHSTHPEVELIAGAIAAFVSNNLNNEDDCRDTLVDQVMAGIVMRGTMPIFYKIPITDVLVDAVSRGMKPEKETIVNAYIPEFPELPSDVNVKQSFGCLKSRRVILSCCEAFKKFF